MQKQISFVILASIGISILWGCGSDSDHATTKAELKNFKGGPMPPDARKKFEESMRKSDANSAAARAKNVKAPSGAPSGGDAGAAPSRDR